MYSLKQKYIKFLDIIRRSSKEGVIFKVLRLYNVIYNAIQNNSLLKKYRLVWNKIKGSYIWQNYIQWPKQGWQYWCRLIIWIVVNGVFFVYFIRWGLHVRNPLYIEVYILGVGIFILGWTAGVVRYIVKYYIKLPTKWIWWVISVLCLILLVVVVGFYLTHTFSKWVCKRFHDLPLYIYYDWTWYEWEKFFKGYYKSSLQFLSNFTDNYLYLSWSLIGISLIISFILVRYIVKYYRKQYIEELELTLYEQRGDILLVVFLSICSFILFYTLYTIGVLKPLLIYLYIKMWWKVFLLGIFGIKTMLYHYVYLGLIKFSILFLFTLIILLLLTLIIATITLIERKVLALVQRRVGPNYIGYKGRFQFIADALKLLLKHIVIFSFTNRVIFMLLPILVLILCYLFWINLIWGPSLALCEIEYNLLFMGILSLLFSLFLFLIGWLSKNKYAILSSNRVIVVSLNLEIFLNFLLLFLLVFFESFSFLQITSFQSYGLWGSILVLPLCPVLIITFLLETGRIPFDLGEAESELIAGYTTEMGGFFFALFYLGEYFHLFCFAAVYVLCFFGGWYL